MNDEYLDGIMKRKESAASVGSGMALARAELAADCDITAGASVGSGEQVLVECAGCQRGLRLSQGWHFDDGHVSSPCYRKVAPAVDYRKALEELAQGVVDLHAGFLYEPHCPMCKLVTLAKSILAAQAPKDAE